MSSFGSTPQRGSSSFGVGGTTQPNTGNTSVLRDQEVARQNQAVTEARRVAGNQQFIAGKQARSQATRQNILKERKKKRGEVLGLVQQQQGRQEARIYQQRLERAVKLGERTPLPEGINIDLGDQDNLDKFREAGFDVPRRVAVPPVAGGLNIPTGDFEVDRVSQGNDVQDTGPRLRPTQRTPQPEPEPEVALIDRRRFRSGGASGGLPEQRSAPADGRSAQQILEDFRPIGNVGLSRQRTAPAGAQQTQDPAQILRDFRTAQQLQSEPLGRAQQPQEPATGPLGDNTPRSRAKRLRDRLGRG